MGRTDERRFRITVGHTFNFRCHVGATAGQWWKERAQRGHIATILLHDKKSWPSTGHTALLPMPGELGA